MSIQIKQPASIQVVTDGGVLTWAQEIKVAAQFEVEPSSYVAITLHLYGESGQHRCRVDIPGRIEPKDIKLTGEGTAHEQISDFMESYVMEYLKKLNPEAIFIR